MATLSRKDILEAADLPSREVEVPEWGGTVLVRGLTGAQRDAFDLKFLNWKEKGQATLENIRATLVAWCVVDEDGKRLFNDTSDVKRLASKSARALERVFDAARDLSGLSPEDVEELAKNSDSGQNGSSGTA